MRQTLKKVTREDNFLSLSGNLVIAFFGFAGFALVARSFTVEVFGEWVIFMSSAAFIEMFRFGITNTALIRYLAGAEMHERDQYIGSNGLIGLLATFFISIILVVCNYFFPDSINHAGYGLFFTWYPILAFINLPYNTALVILQADQHFGKMFTIKAINSGVFFLVLAVNYFFLRYSLSWLILALLVVNAFSSSICMWFGWDGFSRLMKATVNATRTLLDFGKYTTFTILGTNLLRSVDTLIISLSPLGTGAVALYSIPLKLTEIQQIPLRSFVATAFPKMSKASIQGRISAVKDLFYSYSGAMTYLFIFISLLTFIFADLLVLILGGKQYLGIDPVTGFDTVALVRIFSFYGLLLPIDRMTGITLDSINRPNKNAIKVFVMVVLNITGGMTGIFIFKSLSMVAVAAVVFTLVGIWIGFYYLNQDLSLRYRHIFSNGMEFYRTIFYKFREVISKKPI